MTTFRLLRPHVIAGAYYSAGEVVSAEQGNIPDGWLPPFPEEVEALDGNALFRVIERERELRQGPSEASQKKETTNAS
jgi:hypothetical protein